VPLAFLGLEWNDSLSISDILVGGGTILLALFTYKLANVTVALDERNAARARSGVTARFGVLRAWY
jgi:hypothetical protein